MTQQMTVSELLARADACLAENLEAMSPQERDSFRQRLEGLVCIRCGRCEGPMVSVGYGPLGQLFQHTHCPEVEK